MSTPLNLATSRAAAAVREELRPMLRLALPLVFAELGWMAMGVVDTVMAGHAGRQMLGAVALGHGLYYTFAVFGIGVILGLDTLISQAFGRGDMADCRKSLAGGLATSLLVAPPLIGLAWGMGPVMDWFGIDAALKADTQGYLRAVSWGTLPLMIYASFRRFLQSQNVVRPVMFALISANFMNIFGNWVLIFGKLGVPAMGAAGAGYATSASRVYLVAVLAWATVDRHGWTGWTAWPGWERIREVMRLGIPVAVQISFEVAVFAVTTTMLGALGPVALGGHQIALNLVSITYMIPLGISSAVAVRVGQAVGRKDHAGAKRAGWVGIGLGAGFMTLAAIMFWTVPELVARAYTGDAEVVALASSLLVIGAFFQLFDGIQAVATGALRGLGDTRTPMAAHVICYWAIGLPLGWWLTYPGGWGARGFWVGLSLALILIGIVLLAAWQRRIGKREEWI
ncbi:MAG: MATE family efflux transporter [Bryobacteraceae bacterium]